MTFTMTLTLAPDLEGFGQAPCGCSLARQKGQKSKALFVVFTACSVHAAAPELLEALTKLVDHRLAECAKAYYEPVNGKDGRYAPARALVDRLRRLL